MVAIKVLALDSEDELAPIQAEIDILKQCDSDYVVKYYDSFFTGGEPWVSAAHHDRLLPNPPVASDVLLISL